VETSRSFDRQKFGPHGVPVWVATPSDVKLPSFSKYILPQSPLPDGDHEAQVEYLWDLRHGQAQSMGAVSKHRPIGRITVTILRTRSHAYSRGDPTWDVLRLGYDKRFTYRWQPNKMSITVDNLSHYRGGLEAVNCAFPAILKPATHATINRFTTDKAWPVANREELLARYVKLGS